MGLKIKISSGYLLLILVLASIVYLFHREVTNRDVLKEEENELSDLHNHSKRVYMDLLDLSSQAETAGAWTIRDFEDYGNKLEEFHETLKVLKCHVYPPLQEARIDTISILLDEKYLLLAAIMDTFDEMQDVSELVSEKIQVIVSRVRNAPPSSVRPDRTNDTLMAVAAVPENKPEPEQKKQKRSILNLFRRKKTGSAYPQQREQAIAARKSGVKQAGETEVTKGTEEGEEVKNVRIPVAVPLLRSLNREVIEKQKAHHERLLLQMDSLYRNNQILNGRLRTLIGDFETEAGLHLSSGYELLKHKREQSFNIISALAAFVFLFAVALYIIVHRDINKRNRYEKALKIADGENKALLLSRKSMMMAIAHDLCAPLATIRGCAELLPGEEQESRRNEYAENIRHTSDYMLALVNSLMEFHTLDSGEIKLNASIFRLESLFKEIAGNFTSLARKKNLSLTTTFTGLDTTVNGDSLRIRQIVNNLFSNALKFTRQGGMHLDAEYSNNELHFTVQDTGTGMTTEEKERIFGAFERLDNARDVTGFGLGLAICAKLVSRMKGTITVESKPGTGSTFMVFLPLSLADEHPPVKEEPDCRYAGLEGLNVLAIDDDLIQLKVTRELLSRNGIACDCCRASRELIDKLKSQEYDLLLTDIQMPETDGYGILELLRSSNIPAAKQIPVLAVTAQVDDESEYTTCGFSGCIHKPFSMTELMDAITGAVGKTERKRHNPDFTFILSDEDNKAEMLDLFITETRKDMSVLAEALERHDRDTAIAVLHKNLPLWEAVRIDYPLSRLRKLVMCTSAAWTEEQTDIRTIIGAVNKLVEYAKKIQEEEYENNPDYRR